jgi:hypothetical protein
MKIKNLIAFCTILTVPTICLATKLPLPPEVIHACVDRAAKDKKIRITEINPWGVEYDYNEKCDQKDEFILDKLEFAYLSCEDHNRFILNGTEVNAEDAENFSINPIGSPDYIVQNLTIWLKIDYKNNEYLCVSSTLSQNGHGAALEQYYFFDDCILKRATRCK